MNISSFSKCSNCGACYNICPCEAIHIQEDGLFYTPVVKNEKCIDCGVCTTVCPVNNEIEENSPIAAFAGWHKEKDVVLSSSSGGIFYGLSENILKKDGVIFGAAYSDDNQEVIFTSTENVTLKKLQKSKYVESKISYSYLEVKRLLENNKNVLVCGTPCQIAGLKQFLNKEYSNLLTCDFVCGGLPSHKLYQEYLEHLEKRYQAKVRIIDFRPKTHGWKRYAVLVDFENGKRYNVLGIEDPYLRSFLYGKYSVRDYCLECKFSSIHKADITIADFWLHERLSKLRNENGISLVTCNTEKGLNSIKELQANYFLDELELQVALYNHKKAVLSEQQKSKHDQFLQESLEKGFLPTYKKFFKDSFKIKLKNIMVRRMKRRKGL